MVKRDMKNKSNILKLVVADTKACMNSILFLTRKMKNTTLNFLELV